MRLQRHNLSVFCASLAFTSEDNSSLVYGKIELRRPYHQMTLAEIFTETQEIFESDKPEFLKLLESTIDLSELIPVSFRNHFYSSTGRPREYSLTSLLWSLIIQRIFSIPTDSLLLTFLVYSKDLREFCGFSKVPDASKITRFKQEFIVDLQIFFDSLVDLTEPILQEIDAEKASMSVFDTTGLEAYVTENNPKYANQKIRQLKAWAKTMGFDKSYDPYKAAYGSMPTHASADPEIKQHYLNGHSAMLTKSVFLPMGSVLSGPLNSMTRIISPPGRKSNDTRRPMPRMKINLSVMRGFCFLY